MDVLVPIVITAILILLNGMFVAAEFAIIGVPRASIERRAARGERLAALVRQVLHDPRKQDQYIATAQLGITLSSLGLGMYGEHILAEWIAHGLERVGTPSWLAAHTIASVLAITILTYFHIVIGEMVPKSLALQQAERTALWVTRPMLWIKYATYPLVWALNAVGNALLKLVGIDRQEASGHRHLSAEELEFVIQESQAGGQLRGEAGRVLRELFEFGELTAGEVMVPRVKLTGIPAGATAAEVAATLRASGHTRYPVYDGDLDHIVGMVHIKDVLRLLAENRPLAAGDARPVPRVPVTTTLDAVHELMHREHTQLVVVLDEYGGTAGAVTIEDLFEEVIGDIEEGVAVHEPRIRRDPAGDLYVAGDVRPDEVGEQLGVALEHEEVDTIGGLVMAILDRPAAVGDDVTYGGVRFEVIAVDGYSVIRCKASLNEEDSAGKAMAG